MFNKLKNWNWNPPKDWLKIKSIDLHTGGEPLRVFIDGLENIEGKTILEKRKYFQKHFDFIRTGILFEPRGHADMYGAIITEPTTEDADFGTFFLHNEGYSSMCGHAIIALTKLVLDTGIIQKKGDEPELIINVPSGKIYAKALRKDGIVKEVRFKNVPSFLYLENKEIHIPEIGKVSFDIAYGGAFYAFCNADDLGLKLDHTNYNRLIDYGRKIKNTIAEKYEIKHPFEEELSFLYGTIFTGKAFDKNNHSRNVCIFADGELDRSATGSGVSARAALHYAKNELKRGEKITIESILGSNIYRFNVS
ncbi:MAG: proline racemase, partial [Bacteroidales bacterium]|nr:proline racemase [Bacteroidales bacterium]